MDQESKNISSGIFLPGLGDIRIVPEVKFQDNKLLKLKIHVAECIEILDDCVVYRFLDEKKFTTEKVSLDEIDIYGFMSMDLAIRSVLDSYIREILEIEKTVSLNTFEISAELLKYFTKMQNLVSLSKRILVEAEKTKIFFGKYLAFKKQGK